MSKKFSFKEGGPEPSRPGKFSFKEPAKFSFKEGNAEPPPGKFSFKEAVRPSSPERSYGEMADVLQHSPPEQLQLGEYKKTGVFLTVNTNRVMTPANYEALGVAMRRVTQAEIGANKFSQMFTNGATGGPLLVRADRRPIRSTHAVEGFRGKERLHAHGLIAVQYLRDTDDGEQKLFFHLDKFRELIVEEYQAAGGGGDLPNPLPYINFKIAGLSETEAFIYIHKEDGSTEKVAPTPANLQLWHEQNSTKRPKRYKPSGLKAKAAAKHARRHKK